MLTFASVRFHLNAGRMTLNVDELNELSDEALRAHVEGVLRSLRDSSAPPMPQVAPFITNHVLLRLHNLVVSVRASSQVCPGWSKQALLAYVVGVFTGVRVSKSDAEYIGNAQDYFLRDYVKQVSKA